MAGLELVPNEDGLVTGSRYVSTRLCEDALEHGTPCGSGGGGGSDIRLLDSPVSK